MARKNWATLNEESIHRGIAALIWLRWYTSNNLAQQQIRLGQGRLSKFAPDLQIIFHGSPEGEVLYPGFSLGSEDWAVLCWPLKQFVDPDGQECLFLDPAGSAEWKSFLEPEQRHVVFHAFKVHDGPCFG